MAILGGTQSRSLLGGGGFLERGLNVLGLSVVDPKTRMIREQMEKQQQALQALKGKVPDEVLQMYEAGMLPPDSIGQMLGYGGSQAPANVREWDHYSQLTPDQQRQYLEMKRASQMMNLGDRYAVRDPVSNQAAPIPGGQIQLGPNETPAYLGQAGFARQAGAEAATNAALPERKKIENMAAQDKAVQGKSRENATALAVYETAMEGLMAGLQGADTGPVVGRLPAMTTDQQVAEGAVSAMAPVLKLIFRVAGEGTFTDKDQELLLNMVPTRKDTPEAIAEKVKNIDAIVRAKMGQTGRDEILGAPGQPSPTQSKRGVFNPQTGQIEWR